MKKKKKKGESGNATVLLQRPLNLRIENEKVKKKELGGELLKKEKREELFNLYLLEMVTCVIYYPFLFCFFFLFIYTKAKTKNKIKKLFNNININ